MPLSRLLTLLLGIATPALIYFGLQHCEPKLVGALLFALLILRHRAAAGRFLRGLPAGEWGLLAGLTLFSLAIFASNSESLLRLYPALMTWGVAAVFARSLRHPPTVIERIARLQEPDLPPAGVAYTRRVTQIWLAFLLANGTVALATVFASRELWMLWNGLLSYLLMGSLFAGEWLYRHHIRRQPI